jgi:hypothetical protein
MPLNLEGLSLGDPKLQQELELHRKEIGELVQMLTEVRDMASGFKMFLPNSTKPLLDRVNEKLRGYGR